MIGAELSLPMRPAINYLERPFVDGQKIQKLKSNEFRKIDRRFWYGVVLALKVLLAIIHSLIL